VDLLRSSRTRAPRAREPGGAPRDRAHAHALARVERVPGDPHLPRLGSRRCRGTSARATPTSTSRAWRPRSATGTTGCTRPRTASIEYLAVRKLRGGDPHGPRSSASPARRAPGKTSLGRGDRQGIGREFYRISVGGVRDEAEIAATGARTWAHARAADPGAAPRRREGPGVPDRRDRQDVGGGPSGDPTARCSRCSTRRRTRRSSTTT
jgi:hypothetical protein